MRDASWLQSLKAGDRVILHQSGSMDDIPAIATVARVTATQILVGTRRFRKHDGWEPGSGWHRTYISEATPEAIASAVAARRRQENYALIRGQTWQSLDDATLQAVADILRSIAAESPSLTPTPESPTS